jgi:hypothetical protein
MCLRWITQTPHVSQMDDMMPVLCLWVRWRKWSKRPRLRSTRRGNYGPRCVVDAKWRQVGRAGHIEASLCAHQPLWEETLSGVIDWSDGRRLQHNGSLFLVSQLSRGCDQCGMRRLLIFPGGVAGGESVGGGGRAKAGGRATQGADGRGACGKRAQINVFPQRFRGGGRIPQDEWRVARSQLHVPRWWDQPHHERGGPGVSCAVLCCGMQVGKAVAEAEDALKDAADENDNKDRAIATLKHGELTTTGCGHDGQEWSDRV